ncbi:hypothetical protein RUM44_003093 [Polyplax serrata]|uniref:Protein phosphatase 1 regulatory subunit 16A n=1 Tax=Polyplax serrata TaxID=468196 RepID=A0ABR1AXM8_POLSC
MDHSDLVAEMPHVERLSTQERLQLARKRRLQQLKVWSQREKEWNKHHKNMKEKAVDSKKIYFSNSVMLLEAAARNDIEEVKRLLMSGVDPDSTNEDGLTALHQCCIDDNEEMMKLLIDFGANVNAEDSEKWTPLHAAATCAHLHLVCYLISKGANLLAVNADGNMPYDICEDEAALDYIEGEMARRGVTQELIDETRADTELKMLADLQQASALGLDLEYQDYQGATPLHIAAANGYLRVVEYLLDQHVSTDVQDNDFWHPVHAAACWGHIEVLELLVQNGADLNAKTKHDETPADICEDSELRERILQLRTEQETKKAQEAQKRKVKRSQSNNTRTQSVRRTSIRDKSLTSKKDAVEEARLRLTLASEVPPLQSPSNGNNTIELLVTDTSNKTHWEQAKIDNFVESVSNSSGDIIIRREPEGKDYDPGNDASEDYVNEKSSVVVPAETSYVTSESANGKININVTVTINTLADLKKQRAQIRSCGSEANGLSARPSPRPSVTGSDAASMDNGAVKKFAGTTGDVVPDVRTRRCCVLM